MEKFTIFVITTLTLLVGVCLAAPAPEPEPEPAPQIERFITNLPILQPIIDIVAKLVALLTGLLGEILNLLLVGGLLESLLALGNEGFHFSRSEDLKLDHSLVELQLYLRVTSKPEIEAPSEDNWRHWDISYVSRSLKEGLELFRLPEYVKSLPTIIQVHGLWGSALTHSLPMIAMLNSGYKERYNLVAVNVPDLFMFSSGFPWYKDPAIKSKLLGEELGKFLIEAEEQGLITKGQIHLVGFSLGAQCSGTIARTAPGIVATVIGLDPAGPGFASSWGKWYQLTHISNSDAPVVQLYHTSSKTLGTSLRRGTADIVFNDGWYQPGCSTSQMICSHKRSMHIFAVVIRRPGWFEAQRCSDLLEFQSCQCPREEILHLSFPPDSKANGKYFLRTTGEYPFGIGQDGVGCLEKKKNINEKNAHNLLLSSKLKNYFAVLNPQKPDDNNTELDTEGKKLIMNKKLLKKEETSDLKALETEEERDQENEGHSDLDKLINQKQFEEEDSEYDAAKIDKVSHTRAL